MTTFRKFSVFTFLLISQPSVHFPSLSNGRTGLPLQIPVPLQSLLCLLPCFTQPNHTQVQQLWTNSRKEAIKSLPSLPKRRQCQNNHRIRPFLQFPQVPSSTLDPPGDPPGRPPIYSTIFECWITEILFELTFVSILICYNIGLNPFSILFNSKTDFFDFPLIPSIFLISLFFLFFLIFFIYFILFSSFFNF